MRDRSTVKLPRANVVYERPYPNGHSGVVGPSTYGPLGFERPPVGWWRYDSGTWPTVRGKDTGSFPPGVMSPARMSAIAAGPASPGTHASRMAAQRRAAQSSTSGRPL